MHGYIDSISIPLNLHLLSQLSKGSGGAGSGKGKGKATAAGGGAGAGYDVVANWTKEEKDSIQRRISMATTLGYTTLLLTLTIPPSINPSLLSFPTPLIPEVDPRTAEKGKEGLILQLWRIGVSEYDEEAVKGASNKGVYGFSNTLSPLYPSSASFLSVSPTSLPSFSHVALSLAPPSSYSPSLLTLDPSLHPRLPYPLKRGPVNSLLTAGVQIELVWNGLTKAGEGGEGGKRRRNWISGAREVVRCTDGKGIVLSSGAREEGEMRAPEDLINLCTLIGLSPSQAKDTLTINPQRAILRGLSMRASYRGIISNPTVSITTTAEATGKGKGKRTKEDVEAETEREGEGEGEGRKKVKV